MDGSGKTTLADNLEGSLSHAGYHVCRLSVDAFHHPKRHRYRRGELSPEAYYHDSINYEAFATALRSAFEAREFPIQCQTKCFDLALDKEDVLFQKIDEATIVLAEGVFFFDLKSVLFCILNCSSTRILKQYWKGSKSETAIHWDQRKTSMNGTKENIFPANNYILRMLHQRA